MDMSIRKLDDGAAVKLAQMAAKKHMNREEFIRKHLETLAALEDLKEMDMKYEGLVREISAVIKNNTDTLQDVTDTLNDVRLIMDVLKTKLI